MSAFILSARQAHRALTRSAFFPLLLSSGLALGLYAARVWRSHQITFLFLVWNLILAWVPYLASLWADGWARLAPGRWWWLLPGALWLAFFPNASYIVTDFWHLQDRPPVPIYAFTTSLAIARQLQIIYGVWPIVVPKLDSTDEVFREIDELLLGQGRLKLRDRVIVLAGLPAGRMGPANVMKLHRIGEMR